jgi:hypothetical protein
MIYPFLPNANAKPPEPGSIVKKLSKAYLKSHFYLVNLQPVK